MGRPLLISRRSLMGAGAAAMVAAPAFAQDAGVLSFLVVGDWGDSAVALQHQVARSMARAAREIGSAFVISTGDNFYTGGVSSVRDPQWTQTFEAVFDDAALQTPWYAVLGNHDYRGAPAAQVAYTQQSFRWRMRGRYWREDMRLGAQTVSFYFIDTTPLTHLDTVKAYVPLLGDRNAAWRQIEWFGRTLSGRPADWNIVVGHHPILSSGAHGGSPPLQRHIQPLLEQFGAAAYFNGHDHDLEHLQAGAVNYFCSGAGSEPSAIVPGPASHFAFGGGGFASCQLSADCLRVTFHDADGAALYTTDVTRR
jgi:acid phosphatase